MNGSLEIVHAVPGLDVVGNGISVAARLIAKRQGARCVEAHNLVRDDIAGAGEVWVHSMWTPAVWRACRMALSAHSAPRLVRMTHGCLDPVRLGYHHWRKLLVSPVERRLFARCARVVATCDAERDWCLAWGIRAQVEVLDLKSCFSLSSAPSNAVHSPLRLLYLGRRHPLKGLDSLVDACRGLNVELRVESRLIGAAKKAAFDWCDFLVLPTLTENFGLVVAEALEHGRRAIVTDGAPVWEGQPGIVYVKGYRGGSPSLRVDLLREAIASAASNMVECPHT